MNYNSHPKMKNLYIDYNQYISKIKKKYRLFRQRLINQVSLTAGFFFQKRGSLFVYEIYCYVNGPNYVYWSSIN